MTFIKTLHETRNTCLTPQLLFVLLGVLTMMMADGKSVQAEPSITIYVHFHDTTDPRYPCPGQPPNSCIRSYTFADYVTGVLEGEVAPCCGITTWNDQALNAIAVAIRSWTLHRNWCGNGELGTHLVAGHCAFYYKGDQSFWPGHSGNTPKYRQITTNTNNMSITVNGSVIDAQYRKNNGDPTNPCQIPANNCTASFDIVRYPYLRSVEDAVWREIGSPAPNPGDSPSNNVGLSQLETNQWAANPARNWNWQQILVHYYSMLDDTSPVIPGWSHYRANYTDYNIASSWRAGTYQVQYINVQNTSNWVWYIRSGGPNYVDWGYKWYRPDGSELTPGVDYYDARTPIGFGQQTLDVGKNINGDYLYVVAPYTPGTYLLEISVVSEGVAWFSWFGWPGTPRFWINVTP